MLLLTSRMETPVRRGVMSNQIGRHVVLCRVLCRNCVIPIQIVTCPSMSISAMREDSEMAQTFVNTTVLYHMELLGLVRLRWAV